MVKKKKSRSNLDITCENKTPLIILREDIKQKLLIRFLIIRVFITENERQKMNELISPKTVSGEVIYNSVETHKISLKNTVDKDINKIKIISLSNYSFLRGTDRL